MLRGFVLPKSRNLTFPEKKNQLSLLLRVLPNSFLTTSFDENWICRECNFPASLLLRLPSRHVQEHSASASTIRHPNAASHLLFWATTVGWKFESKERISIYKLKPQVNNITHHLLRYFDHPPIMPRPPWPSALFTSRIFSYLQPPGDLAQ